MTENVAIVFIILAAGAITYLLRATPFLLFQGNKVRTSGRMFRIFEYAAYSIIGSLIAGSVMKVSILTFFSFPQFWESAARLLTIAFTFALAVRIRQPIICLAAGLGAFFLLRLIG